MGKELDVQIPENENNVYISLTNNPNDKLTLCLGYSKLNINSKEVECEILHEVIKELKVAIELYNKVNHNWTPKHIIDSEWSKHNLIDAIKNPILPTDDKKDGTWGNYEEVSIDEFSNIAKNILTKSKPKQSTDLWGNINVTNFENSPYHIISQQIKHLKNKTEGNLSGEIRFENKPYSDESILCFYIQIPRIDYSHKLFTVIHSFEHYPCELIMKISDDDIVWDSTYKDNIEFTDALKRLLHTDSCKKILSNLYTLAKGVDGK